MNTPCIHLYICEPPNRRTSRGVCRLCGAVRVFQNFVGKEPDDIAPQAKQKAKRDAGRPALEPKACIICGAEFAPRMTQSVLCGAKDCTLAYNRQRGRDARRKADHEAAVKGAGA